MILFISRCITTPEYKYTKSVGSRTKRSIKKADNHRLLIKTRTRIDPSEASCRRCPTLPFAHCLEVNEKESYHALLLEEAIVVPSTIRTPSPDRKTFIQSFRSSKHFSRPQKRSAVEHEIPGIIISTIVTNRFFDQTKSAEYEKPLNSSCIACDRTELLLALSPKRKIYNLPDCTGVSTGVTLVNSESKLLVSVALVI
jgi:hypothetical protein